MWQMQANGTHPLCQLEPIGLFPEEIVRIWSLVSCAITRIIYLNLLLLTWLLMTSCNSKLYFWKDCKSPTRQLLPSCTLISHAQVPHFNLTTSRNNISLPSRKNKQFFCCKLKWGYDAGYLCIYFFMVGVLNFWSFVHCASVRLRYFIVSLVRHVEFVSKIFATSYFL